MSAAVSLSEVEDRLRSGADPLARIRADGAIALSVIGRQGKSQIETLGERGGYRVKFPAPERAHLDAVVVNTGGGVAGGDSVEFDIAARDGARVRVTTPSAERIYRCLGAPTRIMTTLRVSDGADLVWAPEATILFSGARLSRTISADVSGDGRLVIAEAIAFGRRGSGEALGEGALHDRWLVRREGALIFADATKADGDLGSILMRRTALGPSGIAAVIVAVGQDIAERTDAVRAALDGTGADGGVSSWNGVLVARMLGDRLDRLAASTAAVLRALSLPETSHSQAT